MYELRMLAKLIDAIVGDVAERELDEGCQPRGPKHHLIQNLVCGELTHEALKVVEFLRVCVFTF